MAVLSLFGGGGACDAVDTSSTEIFLRGIRLSVFEKRTAHSFIARPCLRSGFKALYTTYRICQLAWFHLFSLEVSSAGASLLLECVQIRESPWVAEDSVTALPATGVVVRLRDQKTAWND